MAEQSPSTAVLDKCARCHTTEQPLSLCSGCRRRKYCSESCQLKDWKTKHKQECKRQQAAAAAAGAAAEPSPPSGESGGGGPPTDDFESTSSDTTDMPTTQTNDPHTPHTQIHTGDGQPLLVLLRILLTRLQVRSLGRR